ncbi:hypothetical protein [Streptomyces glebosus]|nr:hypothetical protein [Streptomyces glebosus]
MSRLRSSGAQVAAAHISGFRNDAVALRALALPSWSARVRSELED